MTQLGQPGVPSIEVLYFDGCPNHERAVALVRQALAAQKITAPIQIIPIETDEEARLHSFYGSPSVRINGVDIAPLPQNTSPSLACRVYRTPDGHMAPLPAYETILAALRRSMPDSHTTPHPDVESV